jgi:hypothetical protein
MSVHLLTAKASNIKSKITGSGRIVDVHRNTAMILFCGDKHKYSTGNDLEITIFVCGLEIVYKIIYCLFQNATSVYLITDTPRLAQRLQEVSAQVSIQYTYGQLYMYIQTSPFETETETH